MIWRCKEWLQRGASGHQWQGRLEFCGLTGPGFGSLYLSTVSGHCIPDGEVMHEFLDLPAVACHEASQLRNDSSPSD